MIDGRSVKPLTRDTDEGAERLCWRCGQWWPLEPAADAEGRPVMFWRRWSARCTACNYEMHNERQRERRTA